MKKASIILLLCLCLVACTPGISRWSTPEEVKAYQAKQPTQSNQNDGIFAAIPLGF